MKLTRVFSPGKNSFLTDFGLLVLRLWVGLTMLKLHGLDKATHFKEMSGQFPDLLHLGSPVADLVLTIFAELVCSALLVIGLVSRFAALCLIINLAVAFCLVHKMMLTGEHNGEPAFIYLAIYSTLLIAGPGRFSVDAKLFGGK